MVLIFKSRDDFSFDFNVHTINDERLGLQDKSYNFEFDYNEHDELTTYEGNYLFTIKNGANYARQIQKKYYVDAKREYNKKLNIKRFKLNYVNDL